MSNIDNEENWLKERRQQDIKAAAIEDGCVTTVLGTILSMVALEVANVLAVGNLPIPKEWIIPSFIAIQFPEIAVALLIGFSAGFQVEDERSIQ